MNQTRPKKKKKKTGILPLPVETEAAKEAKESSDKKKKTELFSTEPEEKETSITEDDTELELPEVEVPTDESPFLGELVIDHTDDDTAVVGSEEETILSTADTEAASTLEYETAESEPRDSNEPEYTVKDTPAEERVYDVITPPEAPAYPYQDTPANPDHMPGGASFGALFDPSQRVAAQTAESLNDLQADMIPAEEARRRAYRAEKRGLSKGVASGALAGWWLGRRGVRNRMERQQQTLQREHAQAVEQLQAVQTRQAQSAQRRESVLRQTIDRLRHMVDRGTTPAENKQEGKPLYEQPVNAPTEQKNVLPIQEVQKAVHEQPKPPVEELPIQEEMLQAPEGRRYESSAWHRIEVDEKTGRLVEQPTVEYGEAFKHEQQVERLAYESAQNQTAPAVAATGTQTENTPILPPPPVQSTPEPIVPTQPDEDLEFVRQQLVQQTKNPYVWGIAVLILLFLLATGIL